MPRRWSSNLLLGWMLVVAAWALGVAADAYWFPAVLTAVILLHLTWDLRLPGRPTIFNMALLALPFALWYHYTPSSAFSGLAPIAVLFMVGFYAVALGTYHLLCSRGDEWRLYAFAWGISAFTLSGTASWDSIKPPFSIFLAAFLPAALLELRRSQGLLIFPLKYGQAFRYAAVLVLLALFTAGVQYLDVVQLPTLNRWLNQKIGLRLSSRGGLSLNRDRHLGDIKAEWGQGDEEDVMLRLWSTGINDYLRAAAFQHYSSNKNGEGVWIAVNVKEMRKVKSEIEDRGRMFFDLLTKETNSPPQDAPIGVVYPSEGLAENFCLPSGTQRIGAFGDEVTVTPLMTVLSFSHRAAGGYAYYPSEPDQSPPQPDDLEVPKNLRQELGELARRIVGSAEAGRNPQTASGRIAGYFLKNFSYQLDVALPPGKDPVLAFLQDVKAGHCEYFAAAGTLLLRCQGVPARYVTGYLCDEWGPGNTYRLARRKDAHAWVEYYADGYGWTTFDPTPPSARPAAVKTNWVQGVGEWLGGWWQRLWSVAVYGGVFALLSILWSVVVTVIGDIHLVPVWAAIAIGGSLWNYRTRLRAAWSAQGRGASSARVRAARAKLRRAERILGRHGLRRPPAMAVGDYLRAARAASSVPPPVKNRALALLSEYQAERFRPHEGVDA